MTGDGYDGAAPVLEMVPGGRIALRDAASAIEELPAAYTIDGR